MSKFKPGDKVICVDAIQSGRTPLIKGSIYTIKSYVSRQFECLLLEETPDEYWYESRFELVGTPHVKPASLTSGAAIAASAAVVGLSYSISNSPWPAHEPKFQAGDFVLLDGVKTKILSYDSYEKLYMTDRPDGKQFSQRDIDNGYVTLWTEPVYNWDAVCNELWDKYVLD